MTIKEKNLVELLDIFINIVEANKNIPSKNDDRIIDAESLALKFFGHILSTLYIYRGINLTGLQVPISNYLHPFSVHVLTRVAVETYLVFYYIYIEPKSDIEKDFRYITWKLAGLIERQKYPISSEKNMEICENDKILINKYKKQIEKNKFIESFKLKQRKNIIEKGNWRLKSWGDIALSAGLSETNAKTYYSFLCEHAHSGNISITQVRQALGNSVRKQLMEGSIGHILICLANFIENYCDLFPLSNLFYSENYEIPNLVSKWIDIGAS